MLSTYTDYLNQWNSQYPNQVWLRERNGDADTDWSWHQAHTEINAIACWLESRFETTGHRIGLLSRNRAQSGRIGLTPRGVKHQACHNV